MGKVRPALGDALQHHRSGRLVEAERIYRDILKYEPAHADALHLLGVLLYHNHRAGDAVNYLESAVRRAASTSVYHYSLGDAYRIVGRLDDAISSYRRSLELNPSTPEAYDHLGATLTQAERFGEAIAAFEKALELRPDFPEALNNLAFALLRNKEPERAEDACRRALESRPEFADAHNNLGVSLLKQKRLEEAESSFDKAVQFRPDYAEAHRNLGRVLRELDRLEDAISHFETAIALDGSQGLSYACLGDALEFVGRPEDAAACCQRGLERDKACAELHFVYSQIALASGDFERGWAEYEWRLEMWKSSPKLRRDGSRIPAWDGSPLNGRRILLYCEQGLGDNIQFVRYAPLVARTGGEVIIECMPRLVPLFRAADLGKVFAENTELPDCDVALPITSLPHAFRTSRDSIPACVPYLKPDPKLAAAWRERIPTGAKVRIGVVWGGNPTFAADRRRSLRLDQFAPVAAIPGLALFSLQRGEHAAQLSGAPFPIRNLEEESNDIADTAAIISNLDLLITADTMPAHLAGALGAPVWTLLHSSPDWRWMRGDERTPWYPSMRLFRQQRPGDWASVIRTIAEELRHVYHL